MFALCTKFTQPSCINFIYKNKQSNTRIVFVFSLDIIKLYKE